MSTKGRDGGIMEKKGLPKGQQRSSPNPSILNKNKVSVSTESRKVSTSNPKNQPSDKIKPPRSLPPSKVTSTRSKPNQKTVTRPSNKITGSTKPKDAGKSRPPLRSKNVANVKENTSASKKLTEQGLENNVVVSEQNRFVSDVPAPSESDHNIVTHEDDKTPIPVFDNIVMSGCDKQLLEDENDDILNSAVEIEIPLRDPIGLSGNQDMPVSEIRSRDNVTIDGSVDEAHTNDHDNEINVQDQVNETSDIASDRLLVPDPNVKDQENEGLEIERVAQDSYVGSKDVEQVETKDQEHELETTQKEPEYKKTDPDEPEHEETDPKEPEQEETEPKEPEPQETEVPEEPEHQESKVPEEPEIKETELPEEPEIKETELPEEPDHVESEPQELELEETKEAAETEEKEASENEENEETEEKEAENKESEGKEAEDLRSKMVVKKKEVVAHGKKETAAAYNDVIEETVSKLREQRKNRVKALVGAFETVISLES